MRELQLYHAVTAINLLHPQPSDTSLIEITGLAVKQKAVKRYFSDPGLSAAFALEINDMRMSAFVAINTRNAFAAFEHNVPFVTALGLDLQPERTSIPEVDKRMAIGGIPPTGTVVSGNGAHMYFCLSEPADPHKSKLIWERLCKFSGSDPIFNVNRILRIPGTVNWKTPPKWCYLTDVHADRKYTIQQIDSALDRLGAPPARSPKEGIPVPHDAPIDWAKLRQILPGSVLDIIDTGEKNAFSERQVTRSEADWVVVCALVRAGAPNEMIHWIYEKQPVGMLKYRSAGAHYLNRTIESARRATADHLNDRPVSKSISIPRMNGSSRDRGRGATRMYW